MKPAIGIIPARYGANRFPGKPLASILGKPMIQWVHENASQSKLLTRLIIATDDERIFRVAEDFGAEAILTSPEHRSGTERVAEVAARIDIPIIINIQGDEPFIKGDMIDTLIETLQDETIPIATLARKNTNMATISDTNLVKVVLDQQSFALYFSRSPLPHRASDYFWQHIGIYGFQRETLLAFASLPPSRLEGQEKLEQLRALENGFRIKVLMSEYSSLSVDIPEDIIKVEKLIQEGKHV